MDDYSTRTLTITTATALKIQQLEGNQGTHMPGFMLTPVATERNFDRAHNVTLAGVGRLAASISTRYRQSAQLINVRLAPTGLQLRQDYEDARRSLHQGISSGIRPHRSPCCVRSRCPEAEKRR